jgi:hypothetical protein
VSECSLSPLPGSLSLTPDIVREGRPEEQEQQLTSGSASGLPDMLADTPHSQPTRCRALHLLEGPLVKMYHVERLANS